VILTHENVPIFVVDSNISVCYDYVNISSGSVPMLYNMGVPTKLNLWEPVPELVFS